MRAAFVGGAAGSGVGGTGGVGEDAVVDLNAADTTALETLPGIGPALAQRILAWREEHGGFRSVEDLLEVGGIGTAGSPNCGTGCACERGGTPGVPADLRLAGPVGSSWVVGTVLVGVPHLAVPVVVVAASAVVGALVVLIGLEPAALLRVRRSRCCALLPVRLRSALRRRVAAADLARGACALALTTALLVGLLAVAVAVGQGRREPSVLLDASGRTSDVRVRLDRDLAPGDRSVVGTVVAVRTGASRPDGLRVPVRLVPAGDEPGESSCRRGRSSTSAVRCSRTRPARPPRSCSSSAGTCVSWTARTGSSERAPWHGRPSSPSPPTCRSPAPHCSVASRSVTGPDSTR